MSGKIIRMGIIGCGFIANSKHIPALLKVPERVDIVALCDIIEERAINTAKTFKLDKAKIYTDYRDLLKDETISLVHVCTPNASHAFITVDALKADKHVMCEKPMAINTEEAAKMLAAAKVSGKKLTIGYQNRFRQDSQTMYKACRNGDLGEIYFAKAHALRRKAVPTWGVFMDKEQQGGGPLIDIGTHALDLSLWMMDNYKPKLVMGSTFHKLREENQGNLFGVWDPQKFDVEDSAFGFIKMENGATIFLEASWALNLTDTKEAKCTICGTKGGAEMLGKSGGENSLVFNTSQYGVLIDSKPQVMAAVAYFSGNRITEADIELNQWLDAIEKDKDPVVLPEQAFVITQILDAVYRSDRTGKAIEL